MRILQEKASCCIDPPAVPPEYCCLVPELVDSYLELCHKYSNSFTKRSRILELAEPKTRKRSTKFRTPCLCPEHKSTITRMEQPLYTRTEQLSYPTVSRLEELKRHPSYENFSQERKSSLHKLMKRSLYSLYSRLSDTQPPEPPTRGKRWSPKEWANHKKHLHDLAKPVSRVPPPPPETGQKKTKGFAAMKRFNRLATPKEYITESPKEWHLTEGARTYVPTPRILAMSKPKYIHEEPPDPYVIKKSALTYQASARMYELAKPNKYYKPEENRDYNPFQTKKNALKAKASPRIGQMAEPKTYLDVNTRTQPYKVSRNALKAKITPRLNELARPKQR